MTTDPADEEQPPTPPPLDYRGPADPVQPTPVSAAGQAAIGFVAWVFGLASWLGVVLGGGGGQATTPWWTAAVIVVGLIGLTAWVAIRYRWTWFLPGVLLGLLLTCLVPWGILAVVCGPLGGHIGGGPR